MGQHNNEPAMTRLEELQLQRELKEVLLEYIETLHHPQHSAALLTCRHPYHPTKYDPAARSKEFLVIRAIVYIDAKKTQWKIVAESSKAQFGILPALQEFSKDLESEMGRMAEGARVTEKRKVAGRKRSGIFGEEDFAMEDGEVKEGDGEGKRMRF
ncbi:hypothetical protein BKA63DRAFT_560363 [Paraphoma chrysanthemicola]|nr:hypothetical protein BKA63DRAFT_560363 [Paraphoma chrysanthemicola]